MRRLFILALLFGLMYVLQFLQVEAETAFNAKSLAAVGFILLAAYTLGEIAARFGFPKITGYIVTGLLFGPYVINLFSVEVVEDLKIINGLAIGMIALSAGGEMIVASLKAIAKSLTYLVLIKGGLILVAIIGAVYAVSLLAPELLPFLAGAPTPLVLAVGGLFGVLAIGTSPAATIAVINEAGAKGRLADTTLGVAVFKDVVMVVLLAVFIALADVFSTPDAVFDPGVLATVGLHLVEELLAGVVLGVVIILYMRYIGAEMWLFLIAAIFVTNTFGEIFHLEVLLTFIMAGFVVQNFSKYGHDFVHLVESVALPVYVVFFSVAGAGLNLGALAQVGVVAAILVVVRIGAIFVGARLATRLAGEPEAIQQNAWLSFVSQAGVVIGLSIIIINSLPELGPSIQTVVLGTVAINLLAGPVLFKMALARVGEIPAEGTAAPPEEEEEDAHETPAAEAPEEAAVAEEAPPADIAYPEPAFTSNKMTAAAAATRDVLQALQTDFQEDVLATRTEALVGFLEQQRAQYVAALGALPARLEAAEDPLEQANLLRTVHTELSKQLQRDALAFGTRPERAEALARAFDDFAEAVHAHSERTEERYVVVQEQERFEATPDDSLFVRFRKALKRAGEAVGGFLGSGVRDTRTVPFRRIVHYQLDGLLPEDLLPVANQAAAHPLFVLDKARILHTQLDTHFDALLDGLRAAQEGAGARLSGEAVRAITEEIETNFEQAEADVCRYGEETQQRLALALVRRYQALLGDLEVAGTFELSARQRRFSAVYERSRRAGHERERVFEVWPAYLRGAAGGLAQHLDVVMLADEVGRLVDETVVQVSTAIRERVGGYVETAQTVCAESLHRLRTVFAPEHLEAAAVQQTLAEEQQRLVATLDEEILAPLEELRAGRLLNALLDRMLQRFSDLAAAVPETYELLASDDLPAARAPVPTPADPRLREVPMRQVTRDYLETRLARNVAEANQTLFREVDAALEALGEVRHLIRFNLQAAREELDDQGAEGLSQAEELALGGMERAQARLERSGEQVADFAAEVHQQIQASTAGLIDGLEDAVIQQSRLRTRLQQEPQRLFAETTEAAGEAFGQLGERLRRWARQARYLFRPIAEDLLRDFRATLPLEALEPAEVLQRYDQATLDAATLDGLPFIYRKLFAFDPLETDEFMVGREAVWATVQQALRRWQRGAPSSVLISGAPGMGTSSFMRMLGRRLEAPERVHHLTLTQRPSSEEVLVRLLARHLGLPRTGRFDELARLLRAGAAAEGPPPVVLLEDAHHLYRRTPGGFDLLKGLLLLIATTGEQVFWVLSVNEHARAYLDAVAELSDAFALTLTLPPLTRDELEATILARHRFSGLDLRFLPSATMRHRRKYRRAEEAEQQAMLQSALFDQIHRRAGGHPLAALFYWLRAIDTVREHTLLLHALDRPRFGYVRGLDVEALLTLKVVLQQGALTVDDHARIFGISLADSHATLMHLANLNLLRRHARTAPVTFRLNGPVYPALVQELETLNLLA